MIPNFLLNLSADKISLEQASSTGTWVYLGAVKPDQPDLNDAMKKLKALAQTDSEDSFEVMVALPTDQVKTLHLEKTGLARADIVAALEGQTPYNVSELCLDWLNTKDGSAIAAIARDTLNDVAVFTQYLNFRATMFVALPGGNWDNNFAIFDFKKCPTNEAPFRLPPYISVPKLKSSPKLECVLSAKSHQQPADIVRSFATRASSIKKILPAPRAVVLANHTLHSTAHSTNSIQTSTPASHFPAGMAKPVHPRANVIVDFLNPGPDSIAQNTHKLLIPSTERQNSISHKNNRLIEIVTWATKRQKIKNSKTIFFQEHTKKLGQIVGGKPRYLGVFLTTLLLIFMLTVAAWATTDRRDSNKSAPTCYQLQLLSLSQ